MPARARRVVLGVTGGIAAYKAPLIVRGLVKAGCEVRCALTPTARQFVTPLTLATLSRHAVLENLHDPSLWDMAHLSLASWADVFLVAPATADFVARLATGRAEGLLDSLALAYEGPLCVCPAMDAEMWKHPATRENVEKIKRYGYRVWGPEHGQLASGKVGHGRLLGPDDIVKRVLSVKR